MTETSVPTGRIYHPLEIGQTRVVTVEASPSSSLPSLELSTVTLTDPADANEDPSVAHTSSGHIPYYALSYVWGDAKKKVSVPISDVDGHQSTIEISEGLVHALEQCIAHTGRVTIWIDQISIDQASSDEKASQIALMKTIYEHAETIIIWLGDPSSGSDLAFKMIEYFGQEFYKLQYKVQGKILASWNTTMEESKALFAKFLSMGERAVRACIDVLMRPWFRRTWIRQEVTAKRATGAVRVVCGKSYTLWDCFMAFYNLLSLNTVSDVVDSFKFVKAVNDTTLIPGIMTFSLMRYRQRPKLAQVLSVLRSSDATDERDKVFCALSFATDMQQPGPTLRTDYKSSVEEVYTSYAVWHIKKYGDLNFMGLTNMEMRHPGIGMWVPDWTVPLGVEPFKKSSNDSGHSSGSIARELYSASGGLTHNLVLDDPPPLLPQILAVNGIQLASLSRCLEPRKSGSDLEKFYISWREQIPKGDCSLNRVNLLDVFDTTVVADVSVHEEEETGFVSTRGAKWNEETDRGQSAKEGQLDGITKNRTIFFVGDSSNATACLIGIGPAWLQPGDDIYMIQGGKMLYAARSLTLEEDDSVQTLDCTGEAHEVLTLKAADKFSLYVGECFMLGLMDGELLYMMEDQSIYNLPHAVTPTNTSERYSVKGKQPAELHPALRDMDRRFRKIYFR